MYLSDLGSSVNFDAEDDSREDLIEAGRADEDASVHLPEAKTDAVFNGVTNLTASNDVSDYDKSTSMKK